MVVCILLSLIYDTVASACVLHGPVRCFLPPLKGAQKKANCFHGMNLIVGFALSIYQSFVGILPF